MGQGDVLKVDEASAASAQVRAQVLALAGGKGELTAHNESRWKAILLGGARHELNIVFEGEDALDAADRFKDALPEHEFEISGQTAVDAKVTIERCRFGQKPVCMMTAELLLLEED